MSVINTLEDDTPECFKPLQRVIKTLRHETFDAAVYKYRDLSTYKLSILEKEWLFREVAGENRVRADQIVGNKKQLLCRYQIYEKFFRKNNNSYKSEGLKEKGRQIGIAPKYVKEIAIEVTKGRHEVKPIKEFELKKMINGVVK